MDGATVTDISSKAFARGAVVVLKKGGPNMLVVRSFPDRTAAVLCAGDHDGTLRLKDFPTADLQQLFPANTPSDSGQWVMWNGQLNTIPKPGPFDRVRHRDGTESAPGNTMPHCWAGKAITGDDIVAFRLA